MSDPRMIPADEAVAELVRLRTELVELRDYYRRREVSSQRAADDQINPRDRRHLARFAHNHKRTHEALTRILEGGTDE